MRLSDACSAHSELVAAYGPELAALIAAEAPEIVYEEGMTALPVDFRACRGSGCGNGPGLGRGVGLRHRRARDRLRARRRLPRRRGAPDSAARGHDCSGERAGNLYLQYWLYYEDSTSLRALPGRVGSHEDDWEGYQVRIGPGGTDARATSHHGYNYDGGVGSWPSDAGLVHRSAWGPVHRPPVRLGRQPRRPRPRGRPAVAASRWTPADRLALVPMETLDAAARRTRFAVIPPWRKRSTAIRRIRAPDPRGLRRRAA